MFQGHFISMPSEQKLSDISTNYKNSTYDMPGHFLHKYYDFKSQKKKIAPYKIGSNLPISPMKMLRLREVS